MISKVLQQHSRLIQRAPFLAAGVTSVGVVIVVGQQYQFSTKNSTYMSPVRVSNDGARQTLCESRSQQPLNEESESERFHKALAYHRAKLSDYRCRWEYKLPGTVSSGVSTLTSTITPSRSWPDDVPPDDMLPMLLNDLRYCARSPNFRSDKEYCNNLRFRVASALIVQFDDSQQQHGLKILKSLAENGYRDAMTYYGMCLNEGRGGMDPNPVGAVSWFRRCHDMYEHAQSQYELGVAYYTGEGVVENGEKAVGWFLLAAEQDHPAACYMLGDCLLDGEGVEMDRGAALEWLIRSADLGHRGARSRVMAVLEKQDGEDYGRFTDASRQTLVEHILLSANKQGDILQRRATLAKPIGGGVMNPTELRRRHTIVQNSREES